MSMTTCALAADGQAIHATNATSEITTDREFIRMGTSGAAASRRIVPVHRAARSAHIYLIQMPPAADAGGKPDGHHSSHRASHRRSYPVSSPAQAPSLGRADTRAAGQVASTRAEDR